MAESLLSDQYDLTLPTAVLWTRRKPATSVQNSWKAVISSPPGINGKSIMATRDWEFPNDLTNPVYPVIIYREAMVLIGADHGHYSAEVTTYTNGI